MPAPSPPAGLRDQIVDRVVADTAVVIMLIDAPGAGRRARWYRVGLQRSLAGGTDVVRSWGRLPVGDRPRLLVTSYRSVNQAESAVRAVVARRLRRGYRPRPSLGASGELS